MPKSQSGNMKVAVLVCVFVAVYAKHELYVGWKSFFVEPSTDGQLRALINKIPVFELDFLSYASVGREGLVLIKPQYQSDFLNFVIAENIKYRIHAEDVKSQLDIGDELLDARERVIRFTNAERIPYENYQPLQVIDEYLESIAAKYSDTVTLINPGNSFEGHPVKYLKISKNNFEGNKPVIFIDGTIHAREWIAPPVVTYAIHKLVENVTEPDLLEKFDWILFPVVNPDGYKYTFEVERMWRKTRSTDQHDLSVICPGVDGNRNFNFEWNTVGTSNDPCSNNFAGSKPLSEVEVRYVDGILKEHLSNIILYITMHSYGSMILYPWGHDGTLSNYALALHNVGTNMAEAIHKRALPHFPKYSVGNSALVINYKVAGAAEDYAHYLGVPLAYTYELPGFGAGTAGFHLDPKYIKQVAVETWAGVVAGARKASELFGDRYDYKL